MKKLALVAALIPALTLLAQEAPKTAAPEKVSPLGKQVEKMTFPSLDWRVPAVGKEITRNVLPNGLVVFLCPDSTVPTVSFAFKYRGGHVYETPGEDQTASLLGNFLMMGGTKNLTYEELTEELGGMAATMNSWGGDEAGQLSAHCLKEHLPRVLELGRDVLLEPAFREDKLDYLKKDAKEMILREKDYPQWVIGTLYANRLYGDHPYGRIARVQRIEAVTREEILKDYRQLVVPQRSFLAVSGDFQPEQALALVTKLFGGWKPPAEPMPPVQKVDENLAPGVYHFEKDIPQASIRVGHLGVKRGNPDEFALNVMNAILGGGSFKARIRERVRSDEGLAYSVGSGLGLNSLEPSSFYCWAETKNEKSFRTVTIMKESIREMTEKPPTEEELRIAKETIVNSFVHRWTDPAAIVGQIMDLEINGRPPDYYQQYVKNIQAVSAEEVLRVAKKYLHPDSLVVVTVGKRADMKDWPKDTLVTEITLPPEYMK